MQPGALCEDDDFDPSADWSLGGSLAVFAETEIGASNGASADPTLLLDSKEADTELLESAGHRRRKRRASKGQRRKRGRKPRRTRAAGQQGGDGQAAAGAPGPQGSQVRVSQLRRMIAPAWGWRLPGSGRAAHVGSAPEFQATTTQACGLYPFLAGSGSPTLGVPQGRNLLFGDLVCYDPIQWVVEGLTTNPGCYILGQPGCGKSSFIKRQIRGMRGFGVIPWFLADIKGEYSTTVKRLEGRVITVGHGLDRLNPLDTGPLGEAALGAAGSVREQLEAETRSRRLTCLLALLSLVREYKISNGEENVLAAALDALDEKMGRAPSGRRLQPTVPDVLRLLRGDEQLDRLMQAADVVGEQEFAYQTRELRQTLNLLCEGSLKGVFDGQTSQPIDLRAPAVSVDISHLVSSGDVKVAAAILSTWSYAFSAIDGAAALAEQGKAPRRQFAVCLDEGWKALRGAPGLVELGDALTRLNRAKGVCNIWCTHTLADLEALPTEADRSKARGFVERSGVVVLGALSPRELRDVSRVVPLTDSEMEMVSGWSAPDSWIPGTRHPGRGKYLLKSGNRIGIPIETDYVGDEHQLYNTDHMMLDPRLHR